MKRYSKYVRGMCGLVITALLVGIGGYYINSSTISASASLNDDLAAVESKLDDIESQEAVIEEEFENLPYLQSGNLVVKAITKDNISLGAKSYVNDASIDITYEGYTPVTVMGYRVTDTLAGDGTRWTYIGLSDYYLTTSSNKVYYSIRNRSEETAKFRFVAYVLYVEDL